MRNFYYKNNVQIPRSGYRPECIAFIKASIASMKVKLMLTGNRLEL